MPSYGAEVIGPPARPPDQALWDPEVQAMDPQQRAELQLSRLRTLVDQVLDGSAALFQRKLAEAGITSSQDVTTLDDVNRIPVTLKQELRDSEADHPPLGDYRFTPLSDCVRIGQSTGTTGTPTVTMLTRHDLWLEYESAARNWWRNGWRPGQVVTHCHPAYLYGGGAMLGGSIEYFGALNMWVSPPDTDELAEQAIHTWERIHPDVQLVALSQHRFMEVAAKLGLDLTTDCGFPYAWEKSSQVQASPGYVGDTIIAHNVATNTTSTALRYCIITQFTNNGGVYTFQDETISNNICDGSGGSGGFTNGIVFNAANLLNVNGIGAGAVTYKNVRVANNIISGSITTPFNINSYTNVTGVVRLNGNGFNASTDTAPASGNVVCFDTNLQPESDCGTSGTNIVTGVTSGGGLALSGHNVGIIQTCTTNQVMVWSGTAWVCGPGVATGTTNAAVIYTSNTTIGATNVPIANGNYILSASVTTSASAAPGLNLPGVPFDVESGSTPAVTGSSSGSTSPNTTRASVFQMTNNTTSTGATIAAAGSAGFTSNYTFAPMNTGTVIATLTPSGSNVNGNATMKFVAKVAGHNPEGALIYSDNTNYWGLEILPTDANGFLAAEGFNVATSCTTCVVASSPGAGIAHFAGSTQTVTSSPVSLTADVSGVLPLANMTQLFQTNAQTATYQVLATDFADCKVIPVPSGTFTITLVASGTQPATGQCIYVINYGSGVVTVARSGQNINGGTTSQTIPAGSQSAPNGIYIVSDGTNYIAQPFGGSSLAESSLVGATAAATITEGGTSNSITRAGVATANLTAPWVFQNTNSSNNNTSISVGITAPGTSTGQTVLNINGAATGGDLVDFGTGGTWTAGVLSGQTINASILNGGAFQSKGTTAGFVALSQGSTSSAVTPCSAANTHCIQAGTAVTASLETDAPAQAQGIPTRTGVAATIQDGYSGDANHSTSVTIGSGTSIGSTSLCSTAICLVGTYRVNVYVDITTACGTTGTYVVNLIYTDDQGSKTVPVNLSGTGSVPATGVLTTTSTANFGQDSFILRSTGAASINYSTTAVSCGTAGPMVGKLYLSVEPVQ